MKIHLEGMELEKHTEKVKERVPTEEEDPREVPHLPLRPPVAGEESFGGRSHRPPLLGERKRD
jgi:hypothetical protein